ncbi:hypothetical protein OIA45_45530 (plasmid) [Streptomyces chartreusis]|uniref:hypothetical protein n=1 Tax=Streptomyces chartreusis TaxID=1969 RepID=UPI002F90FA15|nr:hypothetical protein OIA45_45530 [Streptomyces chartreusis]
MAAEFCFEVGDSFLGEAEVGAGTFESFLESAVLTGELLDPVLEGGVLGGQSLNGLARNQLVEVTDLPEPTWRDAAWHPSGLLRRLGLLHIVASLDGTRPRS